MDFIDFSGILWRTRAHILRWRATSNQAAHSRRRRRRQTPRRELRIASEARPLNIYKHFYVVHVLWQNPADADSVCECAKFPILGRMFVSVCMRSCAILIGDVARLAGRKRRSEWAGAYSNGRFGKKTPHRRHRLARRRRRCAQAAAEHAHALP